MREFKYTYYIYIAFLMLMFGSAEVHAQNDRNLIRSGNREYRTQKWVMAETQYRKAIAKNAKNSQAVYNLGCALMMQQKDSMAMVQYENAAKLETNKLRRAKSYHNMGVIMQNHQQYAQAIETYKMALRNNPADNETRYNLALCQKLLKDQQQNQKNNGGGGNDKNNKNGKDKDKDKDKNKKDQNKNNDKQNKNQDKNNQNKQEQQDQQHEQMSKENAEQLLNAAVQQEKATKQKLQRAMSQPRRKAYEKNW